MSTADQATTASQAAWKVADAAIAAAFDISVAAMLAEFRETFPQVQGLWSVVVGSESGVTNFDVDAVTINGKRRRVADIKPENAEAIGALLRKHLDRLNLEQHAQEAIYRCVSDDGILWTAHTEPFVSNKAPA